MDGTIRLKDGSEWRCRNGHLLGVKRRERISTGRGYVLYILDNVQIDPDPETPMRYKGRVIGTVKDIRCDICGERKTWWSSRAGGSDVR